MSSVHQQAKDLFLAALACPTADRPAYLAAACGDDRGLREAVESLLAAQEAESASQFQPGHVFAGRYRMITPIGRGGMGEVWRADDLVLQTPVALKLIRSSEDGRERILNEVRLARQITHPAVCRVFDVGEAGGQVFYSMELVQGENLATLVRRVGRLPPEKVRDIGQQLCGGLAAAHGRGVLHRDLKPANVLVDEDGAVRITDFGIAITATDTGQRVVVGTPGYMAPEQLTPGLLLSEKTDLYALGLVLYELLVGRQPFHAGAAATSRPPRPSTIVHDVDPSLERVIMQAIEPDPRRRPASAAAMAASLLVDSAAPRPRPRRRWLAGGALVAVLAVVAVVAARWLPRGGRTLTDQDVIVLADFTNTTGEPVFDGTLKVALAVALEQSPFLKMFPDDRVRETLRLMQHAPDERVTRPIAREIARREQLKALVGGSIGRLGSHYVLALEAINAETGDVMGREQVEVPVKEQVLTSLGTAASSLREKLGESLVSIQRFDVPLPRATTASLEALHAYSLALDQGRVSLRVEAIPHLKRAIELDPNFALAHALLSGVYANTGRFNEAPAFSQRAFELRDRVSERERFFISWRYYVDAVQAWDKALELGFSWTTTYPREAFAFNSLGLASATFGQHDRAIPAFREAIRLDAKFVPPHRNLVGSLIALNRFEEAKSRLREATADGVDSIGLRELAYLLAFLVSDSAAPPRETSPARDGQEAMWSSHSEARTSSFFGQFHAAHERFQQSIRTAAREDFHELGAQWTMEDAESHAIAGQCAEARQEIARGLELGRNNFTLERASRTLALCGAGGDASRLSGELADRFSSATLTTRIQLPVSSAALAVQRGDSARALELLDTVTPYDHAPAAEFWPRYLRGLAYLQMKDGHAAGMQFQSIVDHRGEAPTSPLYPLAHLGLARAARLTGDLDKARRAYEGFLALWNGADSSLQPLNEARQEYAAIR
jgi:eukaryotic-like serine/threonine-protein kinase